MNYSSVIKVPDEKTLDALCAKTFNQLLIHPNVILRIRDINYKLPTAIQAGALPLALSGKDLIVQSPPESGKTLVFAALAAHIVNDNHQSKQREPFVTILAASSEHVTKIKNLIVKLVPDGNNVCAFYGDGDDFTNEKIANGCSVVIGTPDRMAKLCADGGITIKHSQLLIIDDADKLMAPTFVEDIQSVFENRGSVVQVAAFCSSYPVGIERFLRQFMDSPSIFRIDRQDVQLSAANRDDKVAVEDNTPEIDDGIATSQSDQLSKNVSSIESSASPTKILPGSSGNANVDEPPVASQSANANIDEPPVASQSTNANVDEPSMASHSAAVQLSAANHDDKVAPETDDGIAASQSEQLSKNVSSDEPSASPTKTSSGDRQDVQLNAANCDDKVAIKDKTPETDRDVKENTPQKTAQSDQLSKNVSSASPTKTSSGGIFGQSNGFGAQNNGGFGSTRGARGGFGQSSGFGAQTNDSGFGSTRGGSRGGFGAQNNDSGFGSTRGGSRGGFGQSSGFGAENNDSGFCSTRGGSRSGFGAQNNDGGQGFGSTRGGSRGGFGAQNNDGDQGFGSTRGGSRGGFGQSNGFGAENNDSGFCSTRGGSRGGFGGGGSRGGYNRSTEFGGDNQMTSSRGGFGRGGGGFGQINNSDDHMNSSRGGFGRGSYGRGGFGQSNDNQQYSNGFGENQMNSSGSNRGFPSRGGSFGGRGGFGTSDSAENQMSLSGATRGGSFGGGRGGFGTSNSAQDQLNSSGSNRGFPSRGGSFGGRGGFGTSDSAENQINSPILNRRGHFHSNSDYGQSSHGGSGFGHPAADNSQDAPAPEDKPQPLVLGHRFVR